MLGNEKTHALVGKGILSQLQQDVAKVAPVKVQHTTTLAGGVGFITEVLEVCGALEAYFSSTGILTSSNTLHIIMVRVERSRPMKNREKKTMNKVYLVHQQQHRTVCSLSQRLYGVR